MVLVFLANGCEEIEALTPVDILRRGGVEVVTVGVGSRQIVSSHRIPVLADTETGALTDLDGVEAVILPGGMPGTLNLEKDPTVIRAVNYCAEQGRLLGAICAAPSILGHLGLLEGKHAVCYPSFEPELQGAQEGDGFVCRDGQIITAKGMGVSVDFGLALLAALKGDAAAAKVRSSIQCP